MTREEAIAYGNDYYRDLITACCEIDEKHKEFVRMAIFALEQMPCEDTVSHNTVEQLKKYTHGKKNTDKVEISVLALNRIIKALSQEPCDDTISRQYLLENYVVDRVTMPYVPVSKIENAPPVTPICEERGKGECPWYAG